VSVIIINTLIFCVRLTGCCINCIRMTILTADSFDLMKFEKISHFVLHFLLPLFHMQPHAI